MKKRIVVIDNYDSFVYILVQYLTELGATPIVIRNDSKSAEELIQYNPEAILISPGPGDPTSAGISLNTINLYKDKYPILGVCLGHQAIAEYFGASVIRSNELMHGKTSKIVHKDKGIFQNIPNNFNATRYHSLTIDPDSVPNDLEVTATTESGQIMGIQHKQYPMQGVQFHPESVLTEHGHKLLTNFIELI